MRLQAGLTVILGLAYPVLAHLAALWQSALLACGAVLVLLSVLFSAGLLRGRIGIWLLWLLLCASTIWLGLHGRARVPQYAVPVLIDGFVAWLFARSLRPPQEALIARIIRVIDGAEILRDPAVVAYARGLTLLWAMVMTLLALTALLLALIVQPDGVLALCGIAPPISASAAQWSWFANVANYAVVGVLFVLEVLSRRYLLPQAPRRSLHQFGLRIAVLWPQLLRGAFAAEPAPAHVD